MTATRALMWALVLGTASLSPAECAAQDKVVEDLGDGFQAVSVNGGPGAIIDTQTGLILKLIKGRPAIVDPKAGAFMFEGDDGEPVVKHYGWKKGGGDGDERPKPNLSRMKAFMKRVKAHAQAQERIRKGGKATKKPIPKRKTRIELLLELLGAKGEEVKVFRPLLRKILEAQDEIRASTIDVVRLAKGKPAQGKRAKGKTKRALPAAVVALHETFRALRAGKTVDEATLSKQLLAFRAARKQQDAHLAALRAKLRELLTVVQEAKLTAVGVLD